MAAETGRPKYGPNGAGMGYRESTRVSLKAHPELHEMWPREQIVGDVPLLGLGDLNVQGIERRQPGFGRLDMLR
jgi:hypothetical protein